MNIQIFGTKKCNDTKKAERFFKERGIKFQFIDMKEKGMSKGEFNSVAQANGGLENMINWEGKDKDLLALIKYIAEEDKLEKVLENPQVIKTPVVRNGKQSTLGYQPDIWKVWKEEWRCSFRSDGKWINVNELLQVFGGGGHATAAGVRKRTNDVEKFRQEILERIVMMRKISGQDK